MNPKRVPASDHGAFLDRLKLCIDKFPSVNAFAKAAGIPQSTFHNYLGDGEPPRDNLIAIARTAQVSLKWLVTGLGEKISGNENSITLAPEDETAFQKRFDEAVARLGGMDQVAQQTGIPLERLAQVKGGGQMTRGELALLCNQAVSVDWLLTGKLVAPAKDSRPRDPDLAFIASVDVDPKDRQPRFAKGQGESWYTETPDEARQRMGVMDAILKLLPKGPVLSHSVEDDAMKGDFEKGTLVLIDGNLALTLPAVYLFENLGTKKRFLARAAFTDQGIVCGYTNEFYDRVSRFTYSPQTHRCLGRVVQKVVPV